jgi:hypothetical protein
LAELAEVVARLALEKEQALQALRGEVSGKEKGDDHDDDSFQDRRGGT